MQFDRSFFEDEIRSGFYVTAEMKQAWASQLEVWEDFDRACRKNGIKYFADWGTLLGAVRHGGFIPWDDDMDVCMKREDYNRFNRMAKDIMPCGYDIYNIYSDENNDNMLTRIINGRNISFSKEHLEKYHGCPYIAGLDIFPLDYIAMKQEDADFQEEVISIVIRVSIFIKKHKDKLKEEGNLEIKKELESYVKQIEQLCAVTFDRNKDIQQQIRMLIDRLCSLYKERESKEIAPLLLWMDNKELKFPKEMYTEPVMLKFENIYVPAPCEYDYVLKKEYGDYHKVVLESDDAHEYPYYYKYKKFLADNGIEICTFKMNMTEYDKFMNNIYEERKKRRLTKKDNKKKILFMPFKAQNWKNMEPLWRKYIEDANNDVIVMPISYYYKNIDGTVEQYIENEKYPEYIHVISEDDYDITTCYQDEIVIQNPYDEYNVATTVHPKYYAKTLIQNTDKLTYVPWFVTDEIQQDDMRSDKSMDAYVNVPGVVYADEVIVQSDNIRNLYIRKLAGIYGDETTSIWENKIIAEI